MTRDVPDAGPSQERDDVPGMVRRARRRLGISQRELATLLDVSQSAVARWETGRVSPRAVVLQRLLELAGIEVAYRQDDDTPVAPMRGDGARDRAGRRYPAHVDLRASQWWTPPGSHLTNEHYRWVRPGAEPRRPLVGFQVAPWRRDVLRLAFGTMDDHPSLDELRADVKAVEERNRPAREAMLAHMERVRLAAFRRRELAEAEAETHADDEECDD